MASSVYDDAQPEHDEPRRPPIAKSQKRPLGRVAWSRAAPHGASLQPGQSSRTSAGVFGDKLSVYQYLYNTYWPTLTHRLALGINPGAVKAAVREYATGVGAAAIWLDPDVPSEAALLSQFTASMGAGAIWMGWWPSEGSGVTFASKYGIATIASDWSSNLTMHSGMPRAIKRKADSSQAGAAKQDLRRVHLERWRQSAIRRALDGANL